MNPPESLPAATAVRKQRPYPFYGQTTSFCEVCLTTVPAKIIFQDDRVYYLKRCATHGAQKTLISVDIPYYLRSKEYLKPGDVPHRFQSAIERGCPHDCGCVRITSSTVVLRFSTSLTSAICGVRCAMPTAARGGAKSNPWHKSRRCCRRYWIANWSPTWCNFPVGNRPCTRNSRRS